MRKFFLLFTLIVSTALNTVNAQTHTVTGTVHAASSGEAIPGVSILLVGGTTGTISDNDGHFSITVPDEAETLRFSFIGLKTVDISIKNKNNIDVVMEASLISMQDLVVVAYGQRIKENITGAVSTVKPEILEQIPVGSFDNALQGAVAGVNVINSSGMPGQSAEIRIRGVNTINAGSAPLYIIDGMEVSSGALSAINPNDIKSVSVLKDASATSLYGSRASNGVILITTKGGMETTKAKVTYRGQTGVVNIASNNFDQMNTSDKLDYEEYLGIKTSGEYNRDSLENINTNWLNELTRPGTMQSHELSVQGGSKKTKYFISGGYYNEQGIVPTSSFKRYTARVNLNTNANAWLEMGSNVNLSYENTSNSITPDRDANYQANVFNPIFRSYLENPYTTPFRKDGSYSTVEDGLEWANPLEHLNLNPSKNNRFKLLGSAYAKVVFTQNLNLKTSLSTDFSDIIQSDYISPNSVWGLESEGSVSRAFGRNFRLVNTNLLNYIKTINDHNFSVLFGQETLSNYYEGFSAYGEGLSNDIVDVLDIVADPKSVGGNIFENSLVSFFSTVSYNLNQKYFIDGSFRYDGSSRFGQNVKWAPFWSLSGMWKISEEAFMDKYSAINLLKLKMSIGKTGNERFGEYTSVALYGAGVNYLDRPGGAPSAPGNNDLSWEKVSMFNAGLELGLYNRLNLELEIYNSITSDMLFYVPFSYTTGFSGGWENVGKMNNKGIEITIDWDMIRTEDFRWNFGFNIGYNKNEIKELFEGKDEILNGNTTLKVGESYGTFSVVNYAGVNPATGESMYYDLDGKITNKYKSGDAVVQSGKSWIAPWNGGFSTKLSYKGFSASAMFSWMAKRYMINNMRYFTENSEFASYNQSEKVLNFWQAPGHVAAYPNPLLQGQVNFDSRLLENASFLRLKDLTFSYNFTENTVHKIPGVESIKIFAKGLNLLTLTKYTGQDPEVNSPSDLGYFPHVKTLTAGIEIGF